MNLEGKNKICYILFQFTRRKLNCSYCEKIILFSGRAEDLIVFKKTVKSQLFTWFYRNFLQTNYTYKLLKISANKNQSMFEISVIIKNVFSELLTKNAEISFCKIRVQVFDYKNET